MYARFQTTRTVPPPDISARVEELFDLLGTHPGFAGAWLLPPIPAGAGGLLTLWQTRDDAEKASERTAAAHGPRPVALEGDAIYRVAADLAGVAADQVPVYAQLTHFDPPRTDEWCAATLRAGRERILPAVRDGGGWVWAGVRARPGQVRTMALVGEGGAHLVVALTTSVEAIEAAKQR